MLPVATASGDKVMCAKSKPLSFVFLPALLKTKVKPKVKPGGAETPGTESPNVQPKGGIQRIP